MYDAFDLVVARGKIPHLMQISDCPAVTSLSIQVWFREGIYHHNPEGSMWEEVSSPGEVLQISCGPRDLVWAVLWEGQLIVRQGITRDCTKGTSGRWGWRVWFVCHRLY